uniref:NADH-ubiquinone oxidoreductase chain 2 n=1 Tax=Staphylinidae sp. BMNH 1274636 TaxID=1796579 RepID=A0A126TFL5_9COLE|nr:NADH dehydrogenase subunit 2 [Staphylinidae sp. BMNH 1274636]
MFKNYKILFLSSLITGSLISISSFSWMGMWLGLEINLLSIIPLINSSKNIYSSESSMKYFIVQAIASTIFLFSLIMLSNQLIILDMNNSLILMLNSSLLIKMGSAPFHFWFPEVMEGLSWLNCLILLTWQKLTPMILFMYNINFSYLISLVIIMGMLISGIMGFNQISLRKILAYSSINHIAWMLGSMFFMETIWFYYFLTYTIISLNIVIIFYYLNIFYLKQIFISMNENLILKLFFMMNFLSLGGLPPFLGFFPKWLTIYSFIINNSIFLIIFMTILTLITLFYYMRICFTILIINSNEINYFNNTKKINFMIWFSNLLSILGLILSTLMFNFL